MNTETDDKKRTSAKVRNREGKREKRVQEPFHAPVSIYRHFFGERRRGGTRKEKALGQEKDRKKRGEQTVIIVSTNLLAVGEGRWACRQRRGKKKKRGKIAGVVCSFLEPPRTRKKERNIEKNRGGKEERKEIELFPLSSPRSRSGGDSLWKEKFGEFFLKERKRRKKVGPMH